MKKKNMEPKSLKAIDTLRMIFKSKLTSRCLVSFYGWFVVCLVYYAISYYSKSFSEDRYLNVLYAALTEIPAYAAGYYSLKFIGRPRSTLLFLVSCGIMSILLPFIPKENPVLTTFISVAGKGAVTAEFYVVYLAISEIVPTTQRSSSISIASFCGRIGSFIAPFVMFMDKIQHFIPNLILGGLAILCGILTIIYIPETKGVELPDTTEQAENNNRFYGLCIFRKYEPAKNNNFERGGHLIGHA